MGDAVLAHLASRVAPGIDVVFLDTGYHFAETIGTRDAVAATMPVNVVTLSPTISVRQQDEQYGPDLWQRDPDLCCALRKVQPLADGLAALRRLGHRAAPRGDPQPRDRAGRRLGREEAEGQGLAARALDPRRRRPLHRRERRAGQSAAVRRIPVDRLLALHPPGRPGRRRPQRTLGRAPARQNAESTHERSCPDRPRPRQPRPSVGSHRPRDRRDDEASCGPTCASSRRSSTTRSPTSTRSSTGSPPRAYDEIVVVPAAAHHRPSTPGSTSPAAVAGGRARTRRRDPSRPRCSAPTRRCSRSSTCACARRCGSARVRELDALVLAAAGSSDARANAVVARLARVWGARHHLPTSVAFASTAPPSTGEAVRDWRRQGRRHVAVGSLFIAPGMLPDRAAELALEAGAVAVSAPARRPRRGGPPHPGPLLRRRPPTGRDPRLTTGANPASEHRKQPARGFSLHSWRGQLALVAGPACTRGGASLHSWRVELALVVGLAGGIRGGPCTWPAACCARELLYGAADPPRTPTFR